MKIRYKILLVLGLVMITIIASLYVVAENIMFSSLQASEDEYGNENALRFVRNLNNIEITYMNNTVQDWAIWDDTYQFVETNNSAYIESNILEQTFLNLQINMIVFFDESKNLVFGQMYDRSNDSFVEFNESIVQQIVANNCLFGNSIEDSKEGVILLNGQPMIVASHAILTSSGGGPSHGTLIMGKFLDSSELEVLSQTVGLSISMLAVENLQSDTDFAVANKHFSKDNPIFSQPVNETNFAGYVLLNDVNGVPVLIAKITDYRTDYVQGKTAITYVGFALVGICAATFLVIAVLLDKMVVSRLSVLSNTVVKIRKTGDNSKRVAVEGKDELAILGENINGMLDSIDKNTLSLEQTVKERTRDLCTNQEKLQSILLASPDAIIAMDLEGNITECNNQMTQLCGFSRNDLLEKFGLNFVDEKDRAKIIEEVTKSITENKGIMRFETLLLRKDQTKYDAELSLNVIRNEQNLPVGLVAIVRDLSEKKLLEARLFRSERLAAIGELAGMVGHDLRNPLAAIRNADYLLKKKCAQCNQNSSVQMLEIIDLSIEHANKIINDLLDYSREIHLELTETTPKALLHNALSMVKAPKNIKLQDHTNDVQFMVDEGKAVRVFVNLIKNAFDAMPDGGTLDVASIVEDDYVVVCFTDTGVGISKEAMQKMFTPLFTTKAQGMGFGLSISKRIVEAHGGRISVKSTIGTGTTFTVAFPVNPVEVQAAGEWVVAQKLELLVK